jgi:hypothetical protein
MTLAHGEKILAYATAAIAVLFALVEGIAATIEATAKGHVGGYELNAALVLAFGLLIWFFGYRAKRAGVIFGCVFLFLILGITMGAVFLFSGAYLLIRALRLQRYGVASFAGSSKIARERAKARKEGRDPNTITAETVGTSSAPAAAPRTPPTASARYTPKKQQRRRK